MRQIKPAEVILASIPQEEPRNKREVGKGEGNTKEDATEPKRTRQALTRAAAMMRDDLFADCMG